MRVTQQHRSTHVQWVGLEKVRGKRVRTQLTWQRSDEVSSKFKSTDRSRESKAVFRKFLTATKNKMKTPNIKVQSNGATGGHQSLGSPTGNSEEFDRQKQDWQEELDQMSEFLVLKSTEEQKEEGVERPVDTAYVDTGADGKPVLKAVFDVHHFKEDEITVTVEEGQLKLLAQCTDDRAAAVFRKTMVRTMDLPKNADTSALTQTVDDKGILTIQMPFVLPTQPRPSGPNVYPIVKDKDGKRKIRLVYMIGQEFTTDDIVVETHESKLVIKAAYDAEIGRYGKEVRQRDMKQELTLPEYVHVDSVSHVLTPDGKLVIDITLKDEGPYKCEVTTEEIE